MVDSTSNITAERKLMPSLFSSCFRSLFVANALLAVFCTAPALDAGTLRVSAVSGQNSPDGTGLISEFGNPVIGNSREPTFAAVIRENGFLVNTALFRVTPGGQLVLIVDEGRPAPDGNGNYSALSGLIPWINDSGQIAFVHNFELTLGGFADSAALLTGRGGANALQIAARAGQTIPGSGGNQLGLTLLPFGIDNSGRAAFWTQSGETEVGIWRSLGGALSPVVRTGDPNPTGDGTLSGSISLPAFSHIGRGGDVAFHDIAETPGGGLGGLYRGTSPATLDKLARWSDSAPGGGRYFSFFSFLPAVTGLLPVNDGGDVAFFAVLEQTAGGAADNVALFLGRNGGTIELVRRGDPVPDGNGSFLELGIAEHRLNAAGDVLFLATVSGASGGATTGLFLAGPGGTRQVARLGGAAPGGGVFTDFSPSFLALNNNGQVAFLAFMDSDVGLFFWEDGVLSTILREGDSIQGLGAVSSLMTGSSRTGGQENSGAQMLNQLGDVTFTFVAGPSRAIGVWTPDSFIFADGFESGDTSAW